jgi:hypothetical protein
MTISRGSDINNLILYPSTKPSIPIILQQLTPPKYLEENIRPPLTLEESLGLKNQLEDDVIIKFINNPTFIGNPTCQMLKAILNNESQGYPLEELIDQHIPTTVVHNNIVVEIAPGRILNINANLNDQQVFAWEYYDMKGIDTQLCTHHIHIEKYTRPIRQPQRRLNPHLRDIVKEKLQKMLNVDFIYPISDSQWVSPLVIVPKKNGKW